MNASEALEFLASHQPLPPDPLLGSLIVTFDEVRKYFTDHYDERSIPLLLKSFGDGDGFGVYQLVEDTLMVYPKELVVESIEAALRSPHRGVRYWNAQIAALFPSPILVQGLSELLEGDYDLRYAASLALTRIKSHSAKTTLQAHLAKETDDEIRQLIAESS